MEHGTRPATTVEHRAGARAAGWTALAAGVLSLAGLVIGLSGAGYDAEAYSDPATFIALGADAAAPVGWGFWLASFGSYLLLVPVALHLFRWLRPQRPEVADLSVVGAGFYVLLGAAGASILAATLPDLMRAHDLADGEAAAALLRDFDLVRRIAEDGLQGIVQNVAGATWFLGTGLLLRAHRRGIGTLALAVGAALVVNVLGIMAGSEALRLVGLTGHVLLAPLWAIGTGAWLVRSS